MNTHFYSIPLEYKDGHLKYSQCQMYTRNYSEIISFLHTLDSDSLNETIVSYGLTDFSINNYETTNCKYGWKFDNKMFPNTVAMEVRFCGILSSTYFYWQFIMFNFSGI